MGKRGRSARIIRRGKPAKCPKCGGREEAIQMIQRYEQGLLFDAELKEHGLADKSFYDP